MSDQQALAPASPSPGIPQMLRWIAERPRSDAETMDAWRTSCPRLSVWEDAVGDELVLLDSASAGCAQSNARVKLTERGFALLRDAKAAGSAS